MIWVQGERISNEGDFVSLLQQRPVWDFLEMICLLFRECYALKEFENVARWRWKHPTALFWCIIDESQREASNCYSITFAVLSTLNARRFSNVMQSSLLHLRVPLKSETSGGSIKLSLNFPDERIHRRSGSKSPTATNYSFSCGYFEFVNIWLKFPPPRVLFCVRTDESKLAKEKAWQKNVVINFWLVLREKRRTCNSRGEKLINTVEWTPKGVRSVFALAMIFEIGRKSQSYGEVSLASGHFQGENLLTLSQL